MRALVEIVAGFLGAGKTTLINQALKAYLEDEEEKVLLIQYEAGEKPVDPVLQDRENLVVEKARGKAPDASHLLQLMEQHAPTRIFIEANGTQSLEPLLEILETRELRKKCYLQRIITVLNAPTFTSYSANLGDFYLEPVARGDLVVLTATEKLPPRSIKQIYKQIKKLNKDAGFLNLPSALKAEQEFPEDSFFSGGNQSFTAAVDNVASFAMFYGILIIFGFIFTLRFIDYAAGELYLARAQTFITVLVSILLQAFPFILLGVLVSAVIQVLVPESFITKLFSRNAVLATVLAVFAGVFFPVCDCAIIPVMRRLIQKGVPLSAAVTFMLAAPIVDPVVIASTFYAFPDNPSMALYRVFLGVSIAVLAGLIMRIFPFKGGIIKQGAVYTGCSCGYCGPGGLELAQQRGLVAARIRGIARHAATEFFQVGQFLVIAAVFSTYIQTSVSPEIMVFFSENPAGALLTMMAFAFILSICSTSDAFIARNFTHQFASGPIVGFMVFGAMLDIKNLLLLSGNFESRFVIRLVLLIIVVAFAILYLAGAFLPF